MPARLPSLFITAVCIASSGLAQVVDTTLIADTNTPVPNGSGNFYNWGATNIAVDASGRVAFTSSLDEGSVSTAAKEGVYLYDSGTITRIADLNMVAPGQGGAKFSRFSDLDTDGGRVIFGARSENSSAYNLYSYDSGTLGLFFSTAIPGPGGSIMTSGGTSPSMDGTTTVFSSGAYDPVTTAFGYGYFSYDGTTVQTGATSLDEVGGTGGSKPNGFSTQTMVSRNGTLGLWTNLSGGTTTGGAIVGFREDTGLHLVANASTSLPDNSGVFDKGVTFVGVMGTQIVFSATWTGGEGLFKANADGTNLEKLMDLTRFVPGTTMPFTDISWAVAGDDHLVFKGYIGGGEYGLYSMTDGVIHTLLDTTMSLDGNEVAYVFTEGINGVAGDYVGFRVGFDNGLESLYRFQLASVSAVPEPAAFTTVLGLMVLGGSLVSRRRARTTASHS